jgi:16S rRNA C967 or C1407 C5-methylase (RsmB/RsmF family)
MCRGSGSVIALDKNKYKIDRIIKNAKIYQVESKVRAFICDSTNLEGNATPDEFTSLPGQGIAVQSFDRIMLDPPCTGLGQRPVFGTTSEVQKVNAFRTTQPAYQKRLMSQAVRLLKIGGVLVYSTCTVSTLLCTME